MNNNPDCQLCTLHRGANHVCLLGRGPAQTDIMIIGEAPGRREDEQGEVFVGETGKLLMKLLKAADIDPEDVYFTNAVSCRPPDNRTPKAKEIAACQRWLDYQIATVKPKFILTLGNIPLISMTGLKGIKKYRGKPLEEDGYVLLPTFHPSYALRDPRNEAIIARDIKKFKDVIDFGGIPEERDLNFSIIDTEQKFLAMLPKLVGLVSFDLETSGLYPWGMMVDGKRERTQIVSASFGIKDEQFVVPLNHSEMAWCSDQQKFWDRVAPVLLECFLVGQNLKFDVLWVWVKHKRRLRIDFDTMLAHYLLDENALHDLEYLAGLYLGAQPYDIPLKEKQGFGPLIKHCKYAAADVFYTRKIALILMKELKREPQIKRVNDLLMVPVANLFCEIEYHGIYINEAKMDDAEQYLLEQMAIAQKEWDKYGEGVNMSSPKQIGELFYKQLKIKVIEKTPTGQPSTSESVLKRIDHPAAASLIKFRGAKQQHSFFIEGWRPFIIDSRLHPSFKLHGTVTGRPSCEHPNLQQTPRDPRIRSLITAPPGRLLLEGDLSQIELRLAAWMANERNMIKIFKAGGDAHWLTCLNELARAGAMSELILKTAKALGGSNIRYAEAIDLLLKAGPDASAAVDKTWKEFRKKAKAVNFGYLYGMWWKKFKIYARDNYGVAVTDEEAQDSRIAFFDTYPDFSAWHKSQKRLAKSQGYVRSPFGRKRRLPRAQDKEDTFERAEAERQSINSPVQSCASDLNLIGALQLREEFSYEELAIVGTIHDAVLIEVDAKVMKRAAKRFLEIMRGPKLLKAFDIDIDIPILGEIKVGAWSEGKEVEGV